MGTFWLKRSKLSSHQRFLLNLSPPPFQVTYPLTYQCCVKTETYKKVIRPLTRPCIYNGDTTRENGKHEFYNMEETSTLDEEGLNYFIPKGQLYSHSYVKTRET